MIAALAATAAGLAGLAAVNRLLARRSERRHPPRGRFVTVDGARLHYLEQGVGSPVILLHGNAVTSEDFAASGLLADLAREHRVVAFDRPGYGYSERPRGTVWNARRQAQLLLKALPALGLERPLVVGHSWGALVAANMALEAPDAVAGVVLMSGYYRPTPRPDAAVAATPAIPFVGGIMRYTISPLLGRLLAPLIVRWIFAPAPVSPTFRRGYPLSMSLRPAQLRASSAESALLGLDAAALAPRLSGLSTPMLILGDRADRLVSFAHHSEWLFSKLPHARLAAIERGGHMVHHSALGQVSTEIRQFAAQVAGTAPMFEAEAFAPAKVCEPQSLASPGPAMRGRRVMPGSNNVQSGRRPAEGTADTPRAPSPADEPEGTHYEPDPDQLVKVVHQVKPESLPLEGPTDFEARDHADDVAVTDVGVTPSRASVREAKPKDA
jgi:pimeloyl-ACP methyl ester carboxylesterase